MTKTHAHVSTCEALTAWQHTAAIARVQRKVTRLAHADHRVGVSLTTQTKRIAEPAVPA